MVGVTSIWDVVPPSCIVSGEETKWPNLSQPKQGHQPPWSHCTVGATPTFFERAQVECLPDGEDGLDEDAHAALGRVDAAHDAEGVQYS